MASSKPGWRWQATPPRLAPLLLSVATGCTGSEPPGRFGSHFTARPWRDGVAAQLDEPSRWIPQATLLAATPVLRAFDRHMQDDLADEGRITGGNDERGNAVTFGLAGAAVGMSALEWVDGDSGRSFEVLLESQLAVMLVSGGLKRVVDRERPEGSSTDSFPSNHAAVAFSAATYLTRALRRAGDESPGGRRWWHELGWLAYVPAAYVAMYRVEANRHFPSDVAAGAFLGTFLTSTIFDAHYGDPPRGRAGVYPPLAASRSLQWSAGPYVEPGAAGVHVSLRF